jgi:hypothetical protein
MRDDNTGVLTWLALGGRKQIYKYMPRGKFSGCFPFRNTHDSDVSGLRTLLEVVWWNKGGEWGEVW